MQEEIAKIKKITEFELLEDGGYRLYCDNSIDPLYVTMDFVRIVTEKSDLTFSVVSKYANDYFEIKKPLFPIPENSKNIHAEIRKSDIININRLVRENV